MSMLDAFFTFSAFLHIEPSPTPHLRILIRPILFLFRSIPHFVPLHINDITFRGVQTINLCYRDALGWLLLQLGLARLLGSRFRKGVEDAGDGRLPLCEPPLERLPLFSTKATMCGPVDAERLVHLRKLAGHETCANDYGMQKLAGIPPV